MKVVIFFLFFLISETSFSQVFDIYNKLITAKDSAIKLTYFKNVDIPIKKALDTFLSIKNSRKSKYHKDSGFIEISLYHSNKKGYFGNFSYNTRYGEYLIFADRKYKSDLICFSFYKSNLVLITAHNDSSFTLSIDEELRSILKSILYQEMSVSTKKEIDRNADVILISNEGLSKRFYFNLKK